MASWTVAVLWSRFGPYHLARLRGAASAMANAHVIGVEIAGDDRDYAWDITHGADGFERHTIFPNHTYNDLGRGQIALGVRAALDRLAPDVVAINGWSVPEARAALAWARRRRVRAILMSESKADDRPRRWWREAAKAAFVRQFDAALVGGRLQTDYLKRLGFPADRIRVGYDAVDNAYFEERSDAIRGDTAARVKRALPGRYFFACTRFLLRKNLDGLLRAFAKYRAGAQQPWDLVIAGSGEEEASLRSLAKDLAISDAITWAGFVQYEALPSYFALAGAFVHPAKSEAWGLVVNEAAASAVPLLVARPVGAGAELVREGENGFLFNPYDDADIARVLGLAANASEEIRNVWARNARLTAAAWGPDRFGAELAALASPHLTTRRAMPIAFNTERQGAFHERDGGAS